MPTRRIAVGDAYLPSGGAANGARLLAAIVAEQLHGLDEEQRELFARRDDLRTIPRKVRDRVWELLERTL